jgi:hypothetical protein
VLVRKIGAARRYARDAKLKEFLFESDATLRWFAPEPVCTPAIFAYPRILLPSDAFI